MVDDQRIRALFWLQVGALREAHADVLFRLEQREDLGLIFAVRACGMVGLDRFDCGRG